MINKNIKLIIHIRKGPFWDISEMINRVTLSGSTTSVARTLEFELNQSISDSSITQLGIVEGSSVCFYEANKEIYRGNVVNLSKNDKGATRVVCKDIGFTLGNAKFNKNFLNQPPEEVAKKIISDIKLKTGKIASTGIPLTRYFRAETAYNIIMTMYTLASKKNKKKYMLNVNLDKVEIIERGKALTVRFDGDNNIYESEYGASIENLISSVEITNKEGKSLKTFVNKDLFNIYRFMKNEIVESEIADESIAKARYHGVDHTMTLTGLGDSSCKSGYQIQVEDKSSGLIGNFYIDSDSHEWSNGQYKCTLQLNFENIMDNQESGSDSEDGKSSGTTTATTKDWGHGIKPEQLNKILRGKLAGKGDIIIKYCNMYKVNPAVIAAIMCNESAYGNSNLANTKNNFFGMRNKKGWLSFSSVEEGIRRGISNISKNYINKGLNTFEKMVRKYAEGGSAWIPTNEGIIKKITGKPSSSINFGTGVKTDAEANANVIYVGSSDGGQIVGLNGRRFENERQRIIVEEAYKMVGKGRYKYGGRSSIYSTDCSGFINLIHRKAGINIGSSTSSQRNDGKEIPLSQAKAGDIIVMDSKYSPSGKHVVLCVGNGQIIHNSGPQGKPISIRSLYTYGSYTVRRCWE